MKNRITELRKARSMNQSDLAQALDVSRQTVHCIENDKYDPSLPLAYKIARLFGTTIEDVFELEAPPH
ncbi:helix-turn-helix transcriptional regulator [Massilia antarctica]|uniref:Helix-turn-helix transcriptional regulator n=2 Tax=Massilia antarctica TaxID=2765360 RepID=A0AA49A9G4_9BURK|nr:MULTISPECIES: helix-turn-helix transcriptional regulator [Massilia]MCY0912221.1 helix-turn-helix transcriptional regulator [Massilia sp. H27-R4]QPI51394.1 helix-turn-helix transcriptional regulator [Massilia antarctica]CUI06287.1 Transcriptional regulator, Cro/CI family [Janthinobacterium sp. CG23_2]CUU30073.1 Transcriptional regulator, Cro/CI family [Janthinobacterium sp. CG23_2]